MRRKLAVLLVIALLIGISGCSKKEEPASVAEVPPAKQDVVTVAETFVDFALLPALSPVALPENRAEHERLQIKLKELALPTLPGRKRNNAKELGGRYVFPANDLGIKAVTLEFDADACHVMLELSSGKPKVVFGYGSYMQSKFRYQRSTTLALSCASWKDDTTLELMSRLVETPFTYTVTCGFAPGQIELQASVNCSFGPREFPVVRGRLEEAESVS